MNRIVSILPKGEGFSRQHFGAVSLCVRDFTYCSRYHEQTTVISSIAGAGFPDIDSVSLPLVRWYENRTRSYARQCIDRIRAKKATLVEVHNRPNLIRLIAPKINCKIALHLHNDPQEIKYAMTANERQKLLDSIDGVYCVSSYIRNRFLEELDARAQDKVHIVYNGIEMPETLPAKEKLIVFVGRMTEDKGALILAQALRIALPQMPGWRAVFIGNRKHAVTAPLTPYEKQVAETLQPIAAQATLTGFLLHAETLSYFARASIAVIPSLWQEPFGRTALEAMAYGCAVISSGRGGLQEVTDAAALTLAEVTPETLADALSTLAANEQQRKDLQVRARLRAPFFSIARCTEMLDTARDLILTTNASHAA